MSRTGLPRDDYEARILVVDDMVELAESLTVLLECNGYTVKSAADGEMALSVARDFHPHCVLLDIQMPGMDGLELTRQLRAISGDDIVLIAMTGQEPCSSDVRETFALVDHYLHKPFDIAKLEKVLPPLSSFQTTKQEPASMRIGRSEA
jgi:DNA-binding response OmpR family regulator